MEGGKWIVKQYQRACAELEQLSIRSLELFGSVVRDQAGPDSDDERYNDSKQT